MLSRVILECVLREGEFSDSHKHSHKNPHATMIVILVDVKLRLHTAINRILVIRILVNVI